MKESGWRKGREAISTHSERLLCQTTKQNSSGLTLLGWNETQWAILYHHVCTFLWLNLHE